MSPVDANKTKRQRRKAGDIVAIPLGDGTFGFGWVLTEPLVAFFDHRGPRPDERAEEVARTRIAFQIWVMNQAITSGRWRVVGHAEPQLGLDAAPWFFMQDPVSGRLSMTRDGGERVPALPAQCVALECAAVWEPQHVEDRLRDYFAGVPNRWVESQKLKV